ncbi:hypothetical protein KY290_010816 [Solanum tuberosum]|uniref:Uncharacterized protein n=1 Tax=Solanum tuberosum TaxID=4113 RepID=A0ABQ7VYT9_SOLTU|nr:hypothetical protein KY290_010816 [Solanum tuberosum]
MQATQVSYVPYPSKKKDKDDWAAILKVKPRNVIELLNEEVATVSEVNVPFQVEEVEVHEIDMTVSIDENILLNDPNGDKKSMKLRKLRRMGMRKRKSLKKTVWLEAEVVENPQSNPRGHTNTVADGESNTSHTRTLVFLTSAGLEHSQICSSFISKSFQSDVDPNGINWKGVSTDVRNGYFGEFKAVEKGRDTTPIELHLHVHTHGHDGKSFVGERS